MCAPKSGWIGHWRRQWSEGSGSRGCRDKSGRGPAPPFWQSKWRLKAIATELENLFLSLRDHSGGGGGGREGRKKADTELKESMFPAVCPRGFRQKDCPLSSGNPRLEDPTTRSWGTPKAQGAKHTPPSTVLPPPPFFFLMHSSPRLSGESALVRETKNLCCNSTFWKRKGRLPITNLLKLLESK